MNQPSIEQKLVATSQGCLQNEIMPNVLVGDLPPDVHAELQRRAECEGRSLQQYLVRELTRLAGRPTMVEVIQRIEERLEREGGSSVAFGQAAADIREDRER